MYIFVGTELLLLIVDTKITFYILTYLNCIACESNWGSCVVCCGFGLILINVKIGVIFNNNPIFILWFQIL